MGFRGKNMSFMDGFARLLPIFLISAGLCLAPAAVDAAQAQKKQVAQAKKPATTSAKTGRKTATKTATAKPKKRVVKPPPKRVQVASSMDADWPKTFALVKNHSDPVGAKLLTWLYVTETSFAVETHQLLAFVRQNPAWPKLHIFKRKIEAGIAAELKPQEIVAWFQQNPPQTYDGARAYLTALLQTGQEQAARDALAAYWVEADLNKNQTAALAGGYKNGFAPGAHVARLDHLLWEERYTEAEYMLAFVDGNIRAAAQARIALGRLAKNAEGTLAAVPAQLMESEGVLFERLRYRRRKNMDAGAAEILARMPAKTVRPDRWWSEINILVRRALERRDYATAYKLASKHQLTDGFEFSQAEWMMGWLKLRFLKDPVQAYKHFDAMYKKVGTAISLSRGAYWAARAAEKATPGTTHAKDWDKIAAQYPSTFYGQLSYEKLYGRPKPDTFKEAPIPQATVAAFEKDELVRAVKLLHGLKIDKMVDPFLARMIANAKTREQFSLVAGLAREMGRYYYTVQANKDCQQTIGQFLFYEGYPTLPPLPLQSPEKSLVHAIIHRESMFNPLAMSPVGARGLMQLMPGTAKGVAKQVGERYNADRLMSDPRYNTLLGSTYLHDLVQDYGGFYPMAIGAYNAGPGNVQKWLRDYGDPRAPGGMNVLDWIEHIPIYETRNYIQRVLESYYIYRLRFGQEPRTVMDFMHKK